MKIKIIAAIAKNGVIGRTKKPCLVCMRSGIVAGPGEYTTERCTACENGSVPCNELPWPPGTYPEDMEHFKRVTMGHAIAMGRLTKESIPSKFFPLEGRTNIVVSKTEYRAPYDQGWRPLRFESLPDALQDLRRFHKHHDTLYVIGGARLFAEALLIADELVLTLIDKAWEGDVYFPYDPADAIRYADATGVTGPFDFGGASFNLVERRQGSTPELTFTRWVRP